MSIIGQLLCLALATPTMSDIEDVQEAQKNRMLRIIMSNGNATDALVVDGQREIERIQAAMGCRDISILITGLNDRYIEVPILVSVKDISMAILLPPPSGLAIPSGIQLVDPRQTKH